MKKNNLFAVLITFALVFINGCKDDNPVDIPQYSNINIAVKSAGDSSIVPGANVILYNASNNNSLRRGTAGADGQVSFTDVDPGNFFVRITAQNFRELPPENITAVPFSVSAGQTSTVTYYLNPVAGDFGSISGFVNPKIEGILIKAVDNTGLSYSTYSGPDGYYIFFNLPFSTYTLSAVKEGFASASSPQVTITTAVKTFVQEITINQVSGTKLSGSVTFLAVENGIVDITILDRQTSSAVNGLATKIDSSRNYNITGMPEGEYLAWASLQNDGYVMDPDWIHKNPGGLNITVTADTGSMSLNFSVTGAVKLLSPTNPAISVIPVDADSTLPLFSWSPYAAAKEYIIEVRDINGNLIWGGFNPDGTINHPQIPKETTSIRYNFDNSASEQLVKGEIYQWKIYADDDANPNIQTLLSSSEDLMGLFKIK